MNLVYSLIPVLSYLVLLMIVFLCYAPAQNHLRYKSTPTALTAAVVCAVISVIISVSVVGFSRDFSIVIFLCAFPLFFIYHRSHTLHISQSSAIFLMICAFVAFLANFSIIFDAFLHPDNDITDYSLEALLFLLALCAVFFGIFIIPVSKRGAYILDNLNSHRVWWIATVVCAIFYLFNLCMTIRHYSTLHTNKVGSAYISGMFTLFILLILLCIFFYLIVKTLIQKAETDDRNRILELQEKQYESMQRFLESDAKARHDFRQTIYTLAELSAQGDYRSIDEYLSKYQSELPQKDSIDYCNIPALNALLNHYHRKSVSSRIKNEISVSLPETLYIDIIDLCSVVGNVLDNAVAACLETPEEQRFIKAIISGEQNNELYIAISNSFGGNIRKNKDRYLSTHKGGSGIGLVSVSATAEKYGGEANFSHDDEIFYSDIILVNKKKGENG